MTVTIEDLKKYELYLTVLNKQLREFFEEQSPYIHCQEGCSHCCEKGEYPFSEVEFAYLMSGVKLLSPDVVLLIEENIKNIKAQKENYTGDERFMYQCPFLVNNKCSLYDYRGIICRSYGLPFFDKNNKLIVPACVDLGLNYSNVYDFEKQTITSELYKKTGIKQEPLAHNVGLYFLIDNAFTRKIELDFKEIKPMLDWFYEV